MNRSSEEPGSRYTLFVGEQLADLRSSYQRISDHRTVAAESIEEGRSRLKEQRNESQSFLIVLEAPPGSDNLGRQLRSLVEPLDGASQSPRTVLYGQTSVESFRTIQDCLYCHVVDWISAATVTEEALERIEAAWGKSSLRLLVFGMGLLTGAPLHAWTHQATRMEHLIKPLGLDQLDNDPAFLSAFRLDESEFPISDSMKRFLFEFELRQQVEKERWNRLGIGGQEMQHLLDTTTDITIRRVVLLKCWAAYLSEVVTGIARITRVDRRELEEFLENISRDFLPRERTDD